MTRRYPGFRRSRGSRCGFGRAPGRMRHWRFRGRRGDLRRRFGSRLDTVRIANVLKWWLEREIQTWASPLRLRQPLRNSSCTREMVRTGKILTQNISYYYLYLMYGWFHVLRTTSASATSFVILAAESRSPITGVTEGYLLVIREALLSLRTSAVILAEWKDWVRACRASPPM